MGASSNAKLLALAKNEGARGQLDIKAHFRQFLRLTGKTLDVAKVVDAQGRAYLVALDENGHSVAYDHAVNLESAAVKSAYGKLEPKLAAKVASLKPAQRTPVSIWVKVVCILSTNAVASSSSSSLTGSSLACGSAAKVLTSRGYRKV